MIVGDKYPIFDHHDLVDRLTDGIQGASKGVVFVVGAPLTASTEKLRGVDDVNGVMNLIREEFSSNEQILHRLNASLESADNPYQAAFKFLQGRRGQDSANAIIRKAVLSANHSIQADRESASNWADDQLAELERHLSGWNLSPGVESFGKLLALKAAPFSPLVVTSNFDPLIGISVQRAGEASWRTSLHGDGDFGQSQAPGCQVVHIHGYWRGTDTLHTNNQLLQSRPALRNSLTKYLENRLVVVVAYSGWPDIFTGVLEALVSNQSHFPEVLWTFYGENPSISPYLASLLGPGADRNRVTFYHGIDCHKLFPELHAYWSEKQLPGSINDTVKAVERAIPSTALSRRPSGSDRPPNVDIWVGRRDELRAIDTSQAKIVIIAGIGGQGKSSLAAHYLSKLAENDGAFDWWDWRDCKEEGDRLRTQIISAIERMRGEGAEQIDFMGASDFDVVESFIENSLREKAVFVFDNVDSYVDLENGVFSGILDRLTREFARSSTGSRLIITCRPNVKYEIVSVMTVPLGGLSLAEATELFSRRISLSDDERDRIATIHDLTKGHAFWIDMLAVQIRQMPSTTLEEVIEDIRRGRDSPTAPLRPIWKVLNDRQRVVLRAMAETMRPESADLIAAVVAQRMNYKNFARALKSLINLNLIVIKRERNSPDLFDLHPLVRQFVRKTFDRPERATFIDTVLVQYVNILKKIGSTLGVHLPFAMLERWSEKAELEIEAGHLASALKTLETARGALLGGGHSEEFVRVARKLFQSNEWSELSELRYFENVCCDLIVNLNHLEETSDADDLLLRFETSIGVKNARYIKFCDVKAYVMWSRGRFDEAIEWAEKGVHLKTTSDVDTEYDCSHTLALARRDGGDPKTALDYFTQNVELKSCIDISDDTVENATTLGNVGRCLQFMGKMSDALVCFKKSARMLETDDTLHRIINQAFARQWIAEILEDQGEKALSFAFYSDAANLVRTSKPALARELGEKVAALAVDMNNPILEPSEAKRRVSNWLRH